MTHIHVALARWPLSVCTCEDDFKGILLHPWCHCKYSSLLPRKPPWHVPFGTFVKILLCKIWGGWCVCVSCQACVHDAPACPAVYAHVVPACGDFSIAYSYRQVKGRRLKSESHQSCVGCGRCRRASCCGITWQLCDTEWVNTAHESKSAGVEGLDRCKPTGSPAKGTHRTSLALFYNSLIVERSKPNNALVINMFLPYPVCGTQIQAHWFLLKIFKDRSQIYNFLIQLGSVVFSTYQIKSNRNE